MKAIALKELFNEDIMTQIARRYGNIPKGAEIDYVKDVTNMYGNFALVRYEGNNYYVKKQHIMIGEDLECKS